MFELFNDKDLKWLATGVAIVFTINLLLDVRLKHLNIKVAKHTLKEKENGSN